MHKRWHAEDFLFGCHSQYSRVFLETNPHRPASARFRHIALPVRMKFAWPEECLTKRKDPSTGVRMGSPRFSFSTKRYYCQVCNYLIVIYRRCVSDWNNYSPIEDTDALANVSIPTPV